MAEEMVDVEVRLGKETADALNKMTKKELINSFCVAALRERVREEDEANMRKEIEKLELKLAKAESYVEQGRAMIESVMERWYKYDV
jgi:hypothetical protein